MIEINNLYIVIIELLSRILKTVGYFQKNKVSKSYDSRLFRKISIQKLLHSYNIIRDCSGMHSKNVMYLNKL